MSAQLDLFDAVSHARARRHDPAPSKRAAALNPDGRASQAARLLKYLWRLGGTITADHAHRTLTLPGEDVTRGEWSARIGVLIHRDLLERAGEVEEMDRHYRSRKVLAYRLTPAGEAETARMFGGAT